MRGARTRRLPAAAVALLSAGVALALPWSRDMVDQPAVKPQEARVVEPRHAVPTDGGERLATPKDGAELVRARLRAGRELANPVTADADSLARGREVYVLHCESCHGADGRGGGPVGLKYMPPPMDLSTDYVQTAADGQMFYTITHGGLIMPFYRDAISPADRWHVVNYVKSEFARQ